MDARHRPGLVDRLLDRPRTVRPDRRCVNEHGHAGALDRLEHASASLDVDAARLAFVARRLDQPRQVHDRVGALEERHEIVTADIRSGPGRLREGAVGYAPGETEDLLDLGLLRERLEQAGSDVPACACDDDPHQGFSRILNAPSRFFWKISYAWGASSRGTWWVA